LAGKSAVYVSGVSGVSTVFDGLNTSGKLVTLHEATATSGVME
jgi:hypothetical protein